MNKLFWCSRLYISAWQDFFSRQHSLIEDFGKNFGDFRHLVCQVRGHPQMTSTLCRTVESENGHFCNEGKNHIFLGLLPTIM